MGFLITFFSFFFLNSHTIKRNNVPFKCKFNKSKHTSVKNKPVSMATISDYPLRHTKKESYNYTNYRRYFNTLKGEFYLVWHCRGSHSSVHTSLSDIKQ